jgi:hypothetical protein
MRANLRICNGLAAPGLACCCVLMVGCGTQGQAQRIDAIARREKLSPSIVSLSRGDMVVLVPWDERDELEVWRSPTITYWDTQLSRVLEVKPTGERTWRERSAADEDLERHVLNR